MKVAVVRVAYRLMFAAAVCAAITACGSSELPLVAVSGNVQLDGQPLPNATVVFRPEVGPSASGETDAHGSFELTTHSPGDGAVIGYHQVTVSSKSIGVALSPGQPPTAPTGPAVVIPPSYARPETSGLTAIVNEQGNDFSLELKTSP